jgi:hypothetical protein
MIEDSSRSESLCHSVVLTVYSAWIKRIPGMVICLALFALQVPTYAQPPGSYRNSCDLGRTRVEGNTLFSSCKDRVGNFHDTQLDEFNLCVGDIFNDNGLLKCNKGAALPPGSYTQSCEVSSVTGTTLHSNCKDRNGNFHPTDLEHFDQCIGDIFNDNGTLRCNKGHPTPSGSYQQSCELTSVDGTNLHSNCRDRNGNLHPTDLFGFDQCVGDIFNDNGTLRCSKGTAPPAGSYTRSCQNTFVDAGTLHSACRDRSGQLHTTQLDGFAQCIGDILNANGNLECSKVPLPSGSYRQTCGEIFMDGFDLHATCRDGSGGLADSVLRDTRGCISDVFNIDGSLQCDHGDRRLATDGDVLMSFHNTCRNVFWIFDPRTVSAECKTIPGSFREKTTLKDVTSCRGDMKNVDGFVTCNKGSADPPDGSYQITCHDVVLTGSKLAAVCRTESGGNNPTQLDLSQCDASRLITNEHGDLQCSHPKVAPTIAVVAKSRTNPNDLANFVLNGSGFTTGSNVGVEVLASALGRRFFDQAITTNGRGNLTNVAIDLQCTTGVSVRFDAKDPGGLSSNTVTLPCP